MISFDELTHTYYREDGKQLISVTTAIKKYIQPDLYSGVPEAILNKARQKGDDIHKRIDAYEKGLPFADNAEFPEVLAYIKWAEENKRQMCYTEMQVTDGELIAGTIDQLETTGDFKRAVADLKTTAAINMEYLQWQLSLYAYMLEKTYGFEITELYCIHLRGDDCKKVPVERLPKEATDALLEAIATDCAPEDFRNPMHAAPEDAEALVAEYQALSLGCIDYDAIIKQKHARMDEILAQLKEVADREGKTEMRTAGAIITRGKDVTKKLFNKDKFLEAHPDLAEAYNDGLKESVTAGKCKIKFI